MRIKAPGRSADRMPADLVGSLGWRLPSGVDLSSLSLMNTVGVMPVSGLSPPLPGSFSPRLTGRMLFGAPWKAAIIESDSTRNFPSFTDDMGYITVNKANTSDTRPPQGIAQAYSF